MLQCFPSVDSSITTHIFFSSSPYLFRYKPSTKLQSVLTGDELLHFPHIQSRLLDCSSPQGTSASNEMKFKDFFGLRPHLLPLSSWPFLPPCLCASSDIKSISSHVLFLCLEDFPLESAGFHPSSTSSPGRLPWPPDLKRASPASRSVPCSYFRALISILHRMDTYISQFLSSAVSQQNRDLIYWVHYSIVCFWNSVWHVSAQWKPVRWVARWPKLFLVHVHRGYKLTAPHGHVWT